MAQGSRSRCGAQHKNIRSSISCAQSHFVARQPVFTRSGLLWGYELLFRDGPASFARIDNPTAATAEIIVDGITLAFSHSKPDLKVLINIPESLFESGVLEHLPRQTCVLEILEDVHPTKEVLQTLHRLKASGYILALDDYLGQDLADDFLPIVDLVKVEFLDRDERERNAITRHLRTFPHLKLLAEKVENHDDARQARDLGYDLMQGYYFQKPVVFEGNKVPPTVASRMQALSLLSNSDIEKRDVLDFFVRSPELTFRLLKFVNSAAFAESRKTIQSLESALVYLGLRRVRHWLTAVILVAGQTGAMQQELAFISTTRACFLQSMATSLKLPDADNYFMVGLFSLMHALYGVPFELLLEGMALHDDVRQALIYKTGILGTWLRVAELLENGRFDKADVLLNRLGVQDLRMVAMAQKDAVRWARDHGEAH